MKRELFLVLLWDYIDALFMAFVRILYGRVCRIWFDNKHMPKLTHFDIGAWAREKKQKKEKIVENNSTIVNINKNIRHTLQESKIKDLKRKVPVQLEFYLL